MTNETEVKVLIGNKEHRFINSEAALTYAFLTIEKLAKEVVQLSRRNAALQSVNDRLSRKVFPDTTGQ